MIEKSKKYFMLLDWSFLLFAGLIAGLISGLLGIGGGVVLVPSLFFILPYLSHYEKLMQTVIATSLSAMVFTTFFSFLLHMKARNSNKKIILYTFPLIIVGCFLGSLTSHLISHQKLLFFFSIFLIFISLKFFFNWKWNIQNKNIKVLIPAGGLIGFISSFLGIGGGVIALPLFSSLNISLKSAIGTSAFATFITSFFGSACYAAIGYTKHIKQADSFGYIYLPAFIAMGLGMLVSTPLGVKLTKLIPTKLLQKIFAVILFITALNMLKYLF